MDMNVQWRKLLVAGAAGLACGKLYSLYRRDEPAMVRPLVHCSLLGGAAGVALGLGVASYRRLPSHVYALSVGANFAVTTGIFLTFRHLMMSLLEQRQPQMLALQDASTQPLHFDPTGTQYMSSAVSGGLTGSLASLISRHALRPVVLTGVSGVFVGAAGQYLYDRFELWRRSKAIEIHYPELAKPSTKANWSLERFQARFIEFWSQSSETAGVSADVEMLKSAIAEESAEIARLDCLLASREDCTKSAENKDSINVSQHVSTQCSKH